MIKAIVFDMGGVLVNLDLNTCLETFRERAGFERINEFIDSSHQRGFVSDLEAGLITEEEFYEKCIPFCSPGTSSSVLDDCFSALLSHIEPYKLKLLEELAAKYPLYMLSNTNPITARRCRRIFAANGMKLEKIFREVFLSYEMKMLKPGQEIFREVIRRTGLPAEELLYIDDSMPNVETAASAGMQSLYYKQGTDLKKAIVNIIRAHAV